MAGCCETHGVSFSAVLETVESLEGQAGVGEQVLGLLRHAEKIAFTPEMRAEVLRHRCGLEATQNGPAVAMETCDRAVSYGDAAGGLEMAKARTRRAKVLVMMDREGATRKAADDLAQVPGQVLLDHPMQKVFWDWAHVDVALALNKTSAALEHAQIARRTLDEVVREKPARAEFLAIADLALGRAWIQAREFEAAWAALSAALVRQRQLDLQNRDYAEYRLYLVRILHALGACPGGAEYRAEAQRLAAELHERDPLRYEYAQETR